MSILVILSEVGILLILFSLIYWIAGKVVKQLNRFSLFRERTELLKALRQNFNSLLVIVWTLLSLVTITVNSWWIYQGKDLKIHTQQLIGQISPDFWLSLGIGCVKSLVVLLLAGILIRPIHQGLRQAALQAKQFEGLTANDESIDQFFHFLKTHLTNSVWLFALLGCTYLLSLPPQIPEYFSIALKVYLIIIAGFLLSKAVTAIIDSLDAFSQKYSNNIVQLYQRLRHLIPFVKRCLEYTIYISTATVVLQQIEFIANLAMIGPLAIKIIGLVFICRIAVEVEKLLVEEVFLQHQELTDVQRQTRQTLIPLLQSFLKYLIYFGGGIGILRLLDIDPQPIIAAAGLLGLAASLAAKNVVDDIVSGFFILFENHYLVGDFIETGDAKGIVETIELKTTRIRNPGGQIHILRNGEIKQVINYSKGFICAPVDVRVAYDSDLDQVFNIIEAVGKQLQTEYPEILQPTVVDGVEQFGESEVIIRTVTTVKPGNEPRGTHDDMQGIFRKAIKEAFEQHGIRVPYTRRVLTLEPQENGTSEQPAFVQPRDPS